MSIIDALSADRALRSGSTGTSPAPETSREQQDDPSWRKSLDRSLSRADRRESQESSRSATRDQTTTPEPAERPAPRTEKTTRTSSDGPTAAQETAAASREQASSQDTAETVPQAGTPDTGTAQQSAPADDLPASGAVGLVEGEQALLPETPANAEVQEGHESQPPTGLRQLLDNVQNTRSTDATGQQSTGDSPEEDSGVRHPPPSLMQALQTGARQAAQSELQSQQTPDGNAGVIVVDAAGGDTAQQIPVVPTPEAVPSSTAEPGEGEVGRTAPDERTDQSSQTLPPVQAGNAETSADSREPDPSGQNARFATDTSAEPARSPTGKAASPGREAAPALRTPGQTQGEAQSPSPEPKSDQSAQPAYGPSPNAQQQSTAATRPAEGHTEALRSSDADPVTTESPEKVSGRSIRSETTGEIPTGTSSRTVTDVATKSVTAGGAANGDSGPITDQVARGIATATRERGPLRIRLNPPELGTLEIEVSHRNGGISARLNVQSPAAHKAILDNLSQLSDALSQQGHPVNRIDVQLQPESAENGQQGQERESGSHGEQQQDQGSHDSSGEQQQEQPHSEGDMEAEASDTPQPAAPQSARLDQLDIAL